MKRLRWIWLALMLPFFLLTGTQAALVTFDDLTLPAATGDGGGTYNNNGKIEYYRDGTGMDMDGNGGTGSPNPFSSGGAAFNNYRDDEWNYWEGWAYSNTTDTQTAGETNQYSAITGGGAGGSNNYGVAYRGFAGEAIPTISFNDPVTVTGSYFTNTTYAYLAMRDGYFNAKKFGGVTGDDEDWFKLSITGILADASYGDTVDFYLADYRFTDNGLDYIVDDWTWVDLSGLGDVVGLEFSLSSSDNDPTYGMNTPAYFAMDNLNTVPIPGAAWLLGSGILALVGLRRRKT